LTANPPVGTLNVPITAQRVSTSGVRLSRKEADLVMSWRRPDIYGMKEALLFKEFRDFILRGNVVELAVAVIIGAAFGKIVDAFVKGLITPLIGIFGGAPQFSQNTFTINGSQFLWGAVVDAIVAFLIVALVLFFLVVKPMNTMMTRMRRQDGVKTPAPTVDQKLLTEIRDLLKEQAEARAR
jgi:large conductance mechanosensitive channel